MAKKNPYDSDLGTGSSSGSTAYGSGTSSYDEDSRSEALSRAGSYSRRISASWLSCSARPRASAAGVLSSNRP